MNGMFPTILLSGDRDENLVRKALSAQVFCVLEAHQPSRDHSCGLAGDREILLSESSDSDPFPVGEARQSRFGIGLTVRSLDLYHLAVPLEDQDPPRLARAHRQRKPDRAGHAGLGQVGFGEGVPRDYVTGETIETTFAALSGSTPQGPSGVRRPLRKRRHGSSPTMTLPEIESDPRGMSGNAARCAAGTGPAGRLWPRVRSLGGRCLRGRATLGGPASSIDPDPSATAGPSRPIRAKKSGFPPVKMRVYGFHQVKIKVGVEGQDDPARLETLRRILGRRMDLRIDANEAWKPRRIDREGPSPALRPADRFGATRAPCGGRAARRTAPEAWDSGHARRIAVRLPRRGPGGRDEERPISSTCGSPSAGDLPARCGSCRWPGDRGWDCNLAAIRAKPACSRPPVDTSQLASRGFVTSKVLTIATSSPRT